MFPLYFLITFQLLFLFTDGQINVGGIQPTNFRNETSCELTTGSVAIICTPDFRSYQLCIDQRPMDKPVPCPPNQPRCVSGRCTAETPSVNFECPDKDGYYPNPSNCGMYHICVRGKATTEQCPLTNVYNAATHSCVRRSATSPCLTIDCSRTNALVVVYAGDKSIFGVCSNRALIAIGKCQEEYFEMDTVTATCKMACKKEGNLPDSSNCYRYHECAFVNGVLTPTSKECPKNSFFHREKGHCVTGDPSISCGCV